DDVVLVVRADALAQDVLDASRLEHRAHRTTGDNARTGGRRTKQDLTCAVATNDIVGDRAADHGHAEQVLPSTLIALADRFGDLVGLAEADADVAVLIAHHDQRGEAEAAPALDHLGHAV